MKSKKEGFTLQNRKPTHQYKIKLRVSSFTCKPNRSKVCSYLSTTAQVLNLQLHVRIIIESRMVSDTWVSSK